MDRCELEYREESGAWQPLSTACYGTDTFQDAVPQVPYTFRLTATDNVSNQAQDEDTASVRAVTKYYYFPSTGSGRGGGQRVAMRQPSGDVVWLHGDHLGSTSLATSADPNPTVLSRQVYYPFGQVRWVTGTLPTDFGYTGQRLDGTGLMFYHARYYAPQIGRFIQADTICRSPAILKTLIATRTLKTTRSSTLILPGIGNAVDIVRERRTTPLSLMP